MSETVYYKGLLTEVPKKENETLQEIAKRILEDAGKGVDDGEFEEGETDYVDLLMDEFYQKYVVVDNKLYSVEKEEYNLEDSLFKAAHNANGTIEFEVRYYNGGCGFNEAIDQAIKQIK